MTKTYTAAEHAIALAEGLSRKEKLLHGLTGRILVKSTFEDVILPDPEDAVDVAQYMAPELRFWGRVIFSFAARGTEDNKRGRLAMKRILAINKEARDKTQPISLYGEAGRLS